MADLMEQTDMNEVTPERWLQVQPVVAARLRDNRPMNDSWFRRLEDDVRHAAGHLHRHPATISVDAPPQTSGAPVPLADTANGLAAEHAALRASLETGASAVREALDDHAARIESLIADVAAVAPIADSPIVVAAAGALHVPPEVLDGFVKGLEAVSRAFPKPGEAPAAPEQPAEPQPIEGEQAA